MADNVGVMYYQSRMPYGDPLKPSKRKQFPVRNLHYQFHDSVFPESDARAVQALGIANPSLAEQRFITEYNESYLKKRQQAMELNRSLSPQGDLNMGEGGAGAASFKNEVLKNRSYENPHSPIHKERDSFKGQSDHGSQGSRRSPFARGSGHVMTGMLNQADAYQHTNLNKSQVIQDKRSGSPFARGRGGVLQGMNQNYPNQSPNYQTPEQVMRNSFHATDNYAAVMPQVRDDFQHQAADNYVPRTMENYAP